MEMSTHSAAACDMGVKSDRGNRQTVGDGGPRPSDLCSVDTVERAVNSDAAADAVVCACVCECARVCAGGLAVDGRCQISQPRPHSGTTC